MNGRFTICVGFMTVLLSAMTPLYCSGQETVTYDGHLLSIKADDVPLVPLLEEIAGKTGVVIFVSKEIEPLRVSAHFAGITPEKAFKRLLKDHNVVMIFNRVGNDFVVNALKIFPTGQNSGEMNVIMAGKNYDKNFGEASQTSETVHPILPESYALAAKNDTMAAIALGYEREEKKRWREITDLKREISGEPDEEKKQVLSMALLSSLELFEELQRQHRSSLEVDYRLEHFNETMKAKAGNARTEKSEE